MIPLNEGDKPQKDVVTFEILVEDLIDDFPEMSVSETIGALEIVKARLLARLLTPEEE